MLLTTLDVAVTVGYMGAVLVVWDVATGTRMGAAPVDRTLCICVMVLLN